jgi:hypothetical protein
MMVFFRVYLKRKSILVLCIFVFPLYPFSNFSSRRVFEPVDDRGEGGGDGDDIILFTGIDGDGSSESGTDKDLRIFSSISPITTNEGSTIY